MAHSKPAHPSFDRPTKIAAVVDPEGAPPSAPPPSVQKSLRPTTVLKADLPSPMHLALKMHAVATRTTMESIVIEALRRYGFSDDGSKSPAR